MKTLFYIAAAFGLGWVARGLDIGSLRSPGVSGLGQFFPPSQLVFDVPTMRRSPLDVMPYR